MIGLWEDAVEAGGISLCWKCSGWNLGIGIFIGREAWRRVREGCGEIGRVLPSNRGERGEVGV